MHGLHSTGSLTTRVRGPQGPVTTSSVDPKTATVGMPSAAATCIGPESLVSTSEASEITPISVSRLVLPLRTATGFACVSECSPQSNAPLRSRRSRHQDPIPRPECLRHPRSLLRPIAWPSRKRRRGSAPDSGVPVRYAFRCKQLALPAPFLPRLPRWKSKACVTSADSALARAR